jgi:hypothetical protein
MTPAVITTGVPTEKVAEKRKRLRLQPPQPVVYAPGDEPKEELPVEEEIEECPHLLLTDFKAKMLLVWKHGAKRDWLCPDCGCFISIKL